jgi:hypothetical protein
MVRQDSRRSCWTSPKGQHNLLSLVAVVANQAVAFEKSMLTVCRLPAPMGNLLWLDTDAIIHGSADSLLAAEIAFGCLHRYMPEQEWDLVQFSACGMAQLGTGASLMPYAA